MLAPRPDGDALESLSVDTTNTPFTATYAAETGTLSISGTGTIEQYQAILDAVVYNKTSENPNPTPRVATFSVAGGESGAATATSTISLSGVNDAPVITVPASQNTSEESALIFSSTNGNGISVVDVDAPTLIVDIAVTKGVFTLGRTNGLTLRNGDGTASSRMSFSGSIASINAALDGLSFTPDTNATGSAQLTINVGDGGGSGSGGELFDRETISIAVGSLNDAPVAQSGTLIVDEDTNGFGTFSGTDADNDALSFVIKTQPANGTVTLGTGGAFTYRANLNFSGNDSFTFAAFDGQIESAPASIGIVINPVSDAPVASVTLSPQNLGTDDTLRGAGVCCLRNASQTFGVLKTFHSFVDERKPAHPTFRQTQRLQTHLYTHKNQR